MGERTRPRVRRTLVALAGVGALTLTSWTVAADLQVTLAVRLLKQPGYVPTHVFSGLVERSAAGEVVTVLATVCPRNFETAVAGGRTLAGGFWEASVASPNTSVTYRARWEGRFSQPVKVWPPMLVTAKKSGPRSVVVFIDTTEALQNLRGELVELQRLERTTERWRPYLRARLKRDTGAGQFPFQFTTRFTGVGRSLTVRVLVPRGTAAPCFRPRATASIRM